MNDIYSFYQLISKYQIEIPIIQRDYAQGRDNAKAADVRKSLISKMIGAVKNGEPLFFDFVYGRVDGNKFIPFDGQQRLTTLFLFHKYVFEKCRLDSDCSHKDNCICKDILNRFSYATRQSSREFCENLVRHTIIPDEEYRKHIKEDYENELEENDSKKEEKTNNYINSIDNWIYRFITNQPWFYIDWLKDPTVVGMIRMFDEIHNQLTKIGINDYKPLSERLTSGCNCSITFHFVDMGEHKLSDETYIKMNARGKQLTPFENFKASLEQYLENKSKSEELTAELQVNHKDLLHRLNGIYDEGLQKYTGIDGSWLDLFWTIATEGETEKVLPDALMMSFFNRHFMNVWRCWYANKSKLVKKEELDEFNSRIKEELPLYPKKDDFVSFEIYRTVMEECDIEKCLTPIFNICNALCNEDKNIENDCQAVWNRDNGDDKWNLFKGKINNNEETYPSRTAFYALLKYYENPNGDNKTTLAQWMRLVWNIVENYVESEDSYIPALQLIDYIAENNFDITQLGDDYKGVAKYQVKEEIAKAKQIISGGTEWESKIIEAEKYAFFKGAIRFLFTDTEGNINWNDFNTKWRNAQKYFDNDGVKNEYKDKSILLRSLLSRVNISDQWFGNYKNFWHKELLNTTILPIIHYLLTTEQLELNTKCEAWVNDNYLLESLLEEFDNWHILKNWRGYSVLTRYSRRESNPCSPTEIIVLNYHRNNILQSEGITVKDDCKIKSSKFLYGWDIDFKYRYRNEEYFFQWYGNPNEKELDIYLMKKEWNGYQDRQKKQKNKRTDEDEFYCFRVTENMELPNFIKKLDETIKQYKNENVK